MAKTRQRHFFMQCMKGNRMMAARQANTIVFGFRQVYIFGIFIFNMSIMNCGCTTRCRVNIVASSLRPCACTCGNQQNSNDHGAQKFHYVKIARLKKNAIYIM